MNGWPIRPASGQESQDLGALEPVPWGVSTVMLAVFAVLFLFLLVLVVVAVIVHVLGIAPHSAQELAADLLATLVFEGCMLAISLSLALSRPGMTLRRYGYRRFPLSESFLPAAGVIGTYAIVALYIAVVGALHLRTFAPTPNLPEGILHAPRLLPLAAVEACVVAPVVEESFFRGFVFRGLLGRYVRLIPGLRLNFWWAAALSGLLFALFHGELGLIVPFTGVGMLFAWIFRRTGSLWPNILAHAGFNAISLALAIATQH